METRPHCGRFLIIAVMLACIPSDLWAHGTVGQRKFIEPLFAEDANIKDELDLPRTEFLMLPDGSFRSFSSSFEKTLYPNRWSVVIEQSRVYRRVAGSTIAGFDDLEIGTKLALYRSAEHELVLTPALFLTAPTGSHSVAEHHTKLQPALVFAKGFGDLKWGWLRPLALQGDIGYEAAVTGERERHATYDMVLEYSVPYLNRFIRNADTGLTWSITCAGSLPTNNSQKHVPIRRIQRFDPGWGYFGFERDLSPTGGCLRREVLPDQCGGGCSAPWLSAESKSRRCGPF